MDKNEVIISCQAEIEKLRRMQEKAEKIDDFTALAKGIRVYHQMIAEMLGYLDRRPQVNVETSKVLEGGVYGNN